MYKNILIAKLYIKYYPYMKCLLECVFGGSSGVICIKSTQANAREMIKSNMINFTENIST